MGKDTSVALGDHFTDFLARQVGTGRFGTASEVVRAGLRLPEEREANSRYMYEIASAGEAGGWDEGFDLDGFVEGMKAGQAA